MTGLAEALRALLAGLEGLHAILLQETELLRQGQADELTPLTEAKGPQLARVSQCWAALTQAVGLEATVSTAALSARIAARGDAEASRLWSRAETLAREVSHQNRLNGELIQEQLRHAHAALQILRDAANRNGLYGADGQSLAMFSGQRTIDEV